MRNFLNATQRCARFWCDGLCLFLILAIGSMAFSACTETPTATVDAPEKRNILEGKVSLEDFLNPADTFVWLEGFNISTRADSSGEYRIQLPEKGFQSVLPSGVEGVFKLYFYNANYFLKTLDLVVLNGEFVYGKGDILTTGKPGRNPSLNSFLQIRTEISQTEIKSTYDSTLTVSFILSPVDLADTVAIAFPELRKVGGARVFFRGVNTDRMVTLSSNRYSLTELGKDPIPRDEITDAQEVRDRPLVLTMDFDWRPGLAAKGVYEVLPYVIMLHEEIPSGLMASLGVDLLAPFDTYLDMPFGINAARLTVLPAE